MLHANNLVHSMVEPASMDSAVGHSADALGDVNVPPIAHLDLPLAEEEQMRPLVHIMNRAPKNKAIQP